MNTNGIHCAPLLAIRTLQRLSTDIVEINHLAEILKNEICVDDILSGGHTVAEARIKQRKLFEDKALLQSVAPEDLLDKEILKFNGSSTVKTLGIQCNAMSDAFFYKISRINAVLIVTKR